MTWARRFWLKLQALFHRNRSKHRLNDEMQFHLDQQISENLALGMGLDEARYAAMRAFGNPMVLKEETSDAWGWIWLEHFAQDLRYGLRALRKNLGFTAVAVLTLALGIGANTAIFQLIDALRLRAIPVREPQQLVTVQLADSTGVRGSQASGYPVLTNPVWEKLRDQQDVFSGVLAWGSNSFGLTPGGDVRLAQGLFVSGDFFHVLGVRPLMGRVFTTFDDRRGCGLPGAVVSYAFWQRELGGDPSAIGHKLTLDYHPVEIIGITPPGFFGLEVGSSYDVAVPICSQAVLWSEGPWLDEGTVWWLNVMGRLKPGSTPERANAQLAVISPGIFQATLPSNYPGENVKDYLKFKLAAVPGGSGVSWLRNQYSESLSLLLGTAGLVLLIACANLANLMLARATTREHEFNVRFAIGASRSRLIRDSMTESLLLALFGGALGLFLAGALSQVLVASLGTEGDAPFLDLKPDWRLLAFTFGLASLTCILFGLVPALRASRVSPAEAFKSAGRTVTASRKRFGFRQGLVVSQVALSLVLVVGALLFSGSLNNLLAVDAGFSQNGVVIAGLDLFRRLNVPYAGRVAFKQDLLQKIRALPGVESVAQAFTTPMSLISSGDRLTIENHPLEPGQQPPDVNYNMVSAGYFDTLQIPLLRGRKFVDADSQKAPLVAVINQNMAKKFWPNEDALGRRFSIKGPNGPFMEVVGIVQDGKYQDVTEDPQPYFYVPLEQSYMSMRTLHVRTSVPPETLALQLESQIHELAPDVPITQVETMSQSLQGANGFFFFRFGAQITAVMGFLGLILAVVGIYSVVSYAAAQRTREIGIRIAMGASPRAILKMVLRQGLGVVGIGLALGLVIALAGTRLMSGLIVGIKPSDPLTFIVVVLMLTAIALFACWIPAHRATRIDPLVALRHE